ncbi:ArsR/SmtB family transcription factor [Streptomyces sp. NPDC087894]|uniref:ArsR/SmtB family transcription factor n=1 Tax=Streptomyces sp. NPDC087894 TaxID=3365816 RepID=UPI00381A542D
MGHGRDEQTTATTRERLDAVGAARVAETLQALATPSRLRILARLQEGPCAVGDLAEAVEMEPSACSHQLRLLRNLGLVAGERRGRSIVYALYDRHVAELLDQALHHVEHLRLGLRDTPPRSPSRPHAADRRTPGAERAGGNPGAPGALNHA